MRSGPNWRRSASAGVTSLGVTRTTLQKRAPGGRLRPSHHQSGSSVRKRSRLLKVGSSHLRKALYFPAITALRCNAAVKAFSQRLSERGKAKMVVVAAAMRKLPHICYGVLKSARPFDASLHPGT